MSVAFNSVSDSIMGASNDNSIKLWALNTFRLQVCFLDGICESTDKALEQTSLTGHVGKVYSAKFLENQMAVRLF